MTEKEMFDAFNAWYSKRWLDESGRLFTRRELREAFYAAFAVPSETGRREPTPIGLFWQTADGRWHFSPGSFSRGDIHDNGRPIHMALLGEEAK